MKTDQVKKKLTPEATLQQIISTHGVAQELLTSIGLDLSNHTDKTLRQLCMEKQWSEQEVLKWIKKNQTISAGKTVDDDLQEKITNDHQIPEICDILMNDTLPVIADHATAIGKRYKRVSRVHGEQYPWLRQTGEDIKRLLEILPLYTKFEKEKFFPLAKELQKQKERILDGDAQSLKRSVKLIKGDHKRIGRLMKTIRNLSNNFAYDEKAGSVYRNLCNRLNSLFTTLDVHITIEKNDLLPKIDQKFDSI